MTKEVKSGLFSAIAGLLVLGSYGVSTLFGEGEESGNFDLLCQESNANSEHMAEGTIGKKYSYFLAGVYGVAGDRKGNKRNEIWWKLSYKAWKEDSKTDLSPEFGQGKISTPYANYEGPDKEAADTNKTLNLVCKKVYEKQATTIEGPEQDKVKLKRDLLKYCSPLGQAPVTISVAGTTDSYQDANSYGKDNPTKLVDPDNDTNKLFWELKNLEFFGIGSKTGIGANLKEENSLFKKFYEIKPKRNKQQESEPKLEQIKDICKKAYKLTAFGSSEEKATSEKTLQFCSFEGK